MSEGIQGNNDRRQQNFISDPYLEEKQQQAARTQQPTERSFATLRAVSPRAGALLVETYGKLVGKKPYPVSPSKVLFEYAKFLVSDFVEFPRDCRPVPSFCC